VNKGATRAERSDSLNISAAGRGWADSRRRASEPSAPVMRDQLGQVEGGRGGEVAAVSPVPPARPRRPQPTGRRPFKRRPGFVFFKFKKP
jgi:hypothetical protein